MSYSRWPEFYIYWDDNSDKTTKAGQYVAVLPTDGKCHYFKYLDVLNNMEDIVAKLMKDCPDKNEGLLRECLQDFIHDVEVDDSLK